MNAYGINRFTATMNITVPAHMIVIGSGKRRRRQHPVRRSLRCGLPAKTLHLHLGQAEFSRHHRGRQSSRNSRAMKPALDLHVFFKPRIRSMASRRTPPPRQGIHYYVTPLRPAAFDHAESGRDSRMTPCPPPGRRKSPAIASRAVTEKVNYRLLANTIAHQWWGAVGQSGFPG